MSRQFLNHVLRSRWRTVRCAELARAASVTASFALMARMAPILRGLDPSKPSSFRSGTQPRPALLRLVDVPEYRRCRAVDDAGQRFPPHAGGNVLAQRNVGHLFIDASLDLGGDFLLLIGRARTRVLIAQLLDLGVFRPA